MEIEFLKNRIFPEIFSVVLPLVIICGLFLGTEWLNNTSIYRNELLNSEINY